MHAGTLQKEEKGSRTKTLVIAFFFIVLTLLVASFGLIQVETQLRQRTLGLLQTTLRTTHESYKNVWLKNLIKDMSVWASDPFTIENTRLLLATTREPATLIGSEAQQSIRTFFKNLQKRQDALGMFIIAPDCTNLASMRDVNVGQPNLIDNWRTNNLINVFQGVPQLVPPLPSDVPLPNDTGQLIENSPTMFILVPIWDKGQVIAALAVRLDPFETFSKIARIGNIGATGETYLFDRQGLMITESRFNEQLVHVGLIAAGENSLLKVKLRDPGQNLLITPLQDSYQVAELEHQPYTLMAQSALAANTGSSAKAYRDYRGVPVLGAWLWDTALGIGFATEIDENEALASYRSTQVTVMVMFIMTLLLGLAFVYLTRRLQQQATATLAKSETFLRVVLDHAMDGIVTIDKESVIETFNLAAEDIFGYLAGEVVGRNLHMLIPKPHRNTHAKHVKNYSETNHSKSMSSGREVSGLHKDGRIIPIRVGLSESRIGDRQIFTAMIQDLTVQNEKNRELRNLTRAVEQSPAAIIITDYKSVIEYVNPAFSRMSGYSPTEVIGQNPSILQSGRASADIYKEIWKTIKDGNEFKGELINRNKNGELFWQAVSISPIRDASGKISHFLGIQEDITLRKQADEALLRFRAALDSASDGIYLIDCEKMKFIDANRAGWEYLGYEQDELLSLGPDAIVPGFSKAELAKRLDEILTNNDPDGAVIRSDHQRKDGTRFPVETRLHVIESESSKLLVAVSHDETEHNRTANELRQAKNTAEAASRAKTDFLSCMSHELRTPMNAITGFTHLLRRAGLAAEQVEWLDKISTSSEHLLSVINDILDLSKIEAGKVVLEQADFKLDAVFGHVESLMREQAGVRDLVFETDQNGVPQWLRGDLTRLRQALLNYVGNAVKFTKQGTIYLRAKTLEERVDQILVRFEVQDMGIGIEPDKLSRLFTAFEQADASTTRKHGGTGLGLSITQHLAHLMGGEAGAESEPDKGSIFWFTAWLARGHGSMPDEMPDMATGAETQIHHCHRGARILLVEDNAINCEVAQQLLSGAGLVVETAENGIEAVKMVAATTYDLVLMDVQMPEMDGLEATRIIRSLDDKQNIPILAMTANVFAEDRQACILAGMNDFVAKPIDLEDLFSTISKWLPER